MTLENGLTYLMQKGHPKESKRYNTGKTVEYISFSPIPENLWVFAFDEQSPTDIKRRGNIKQAVFQKKYKCIFTDNNIPFKVEKRNTQNLLVSFEHLNDAIKVAAKFSLDIGQIGGSRVIKGNYKGFVDEDGLQARIIDFWDILDFGCELELLDSLVSVKFESGRGEIDLLAQVKSTGAIVVIELKYPAAYEEVLEKQIYKYMNSKEVIKRARKNDSNIIGCIIAEEIKPKLISAVNSSPMPIVAFKAMWTEGGVDLLKVAGSLSGASIFPVVSTNNQFVTFVTLFLGIEN